MYIVEGNIGAGKSTFLRLVEKHLPSVSVLYEPVAAWQQVSSGESILENFYKDPHRWAYTMETASMTSRAQEHLRIESSNHPFQIMERSIYSGRYVFAQNGFDVGFLTSLEWRIYNEWFTFLTKDICQLPQGFIYLKVDPEVAYKRIQKRQRSAESSIPLEYIKQIDKCHEEFLLNKRNVCPELSSVPVLVIDCNAEFELASEEFQRHRDSLEAFMLAHSDPSAKGFYASLAEL